MSAGECFKFIASFWDSNPSVTTGYEAITDHVVKTFEIGTACINILDAKVSGYDVHSKGFSKLSKSYLKNEKGGKTETVPRVMADIIAKEGEIHAQMCEQLRKDSIDPLKEVIKVEYDKFKKKKLECSKSLKDRKATNEAAIKACKSFTAKNKEHLAFIKKYPNFDQDEKIKPKFTKSLQTVKNAEKDAKTSVEELTTALCAYEKEFTAYCKLAEEIDRSVFNQIVDSLKIASACGSDIFSRLSSVVKQQEDLANECGPEEYMDKFLKEKGTDNVYYNNAYISENEVDGNKEFIVKLGDPDSGGYNSNPRKSYTQAANISFKSSENSSKNNTLNHMGESFGDEHGKAAGFPSASTDYMVGDIVVAIFDYTAQADDELSFSKGEIIRITGTEDESWYIGSINNGKNGIFPIAYVGKR